MHSHPHVTQLCCPSLLPWQVINEEQINQAADIIADTLKIFE